jgi:hypothetical protein
MAFRFRTNSGRKPHPAVPELANRFLRGEISERDWILQDNAVMAQPFWADRFGAVAKNVQGFRLHPSIYGDLSKTWLA